jgi:hypothetical protein
MEENITFLDISEKLKETIGLKFDKQLADKLGIREDAYKQRKREKSIPFKEIINLCKTEGISLTWLFFNIGPRRLKNFGKHEIPQLSPKEKQDLFRIIENSDGIGRLLYMFLNRREGKEDNREDRVERRG